MAATIPAMSRADLDVLKADADDLIYGLTDEYRKLIYADASVQQQLTDEQNVLLGFVAWDGQVCNGGIIQLIENGYGPFIFETAISQVLKAWGLEQTAALIDRARPLYQAKKTELEREKTLEEFAKMYAAHPEFEPLDDAYFPIADEERLRMATYVGAHEELFVKIV